MIMKNRRLFVRFLNSGSGYVEFAGYKNLTGPCGSDSLRFLNKSREKSALSIYLSFPTNRIAKIMQLSHYSSISLWKYLDFTIFHINILPFLWSFSDPDLLNFSEKDPALCEQLWYLEIQLGAHKKSSLLIDAGPEEHEFIQTWSQRYLV